MILSKQKTFLASCCAILFGFLCFGISAAAQAQHNIARSNATQTQLSSIMPEEQMLPNFVPLRPAGEYYMVDQWSQTDQKWVTPVSKSKVLPDAFSPSVDLKYYGASGFATRMTRHLYSTDGLYHLSIDFLVCDSNDAAQNYILQYRNQGQAVMVPGNAQDSQPIGDESWVDASTNGMRQNTDSILMRVGRLVADVGWELTNTARQHGVYQRFPASALEALAYEILLRASDQPEVTSVSAQQAHVNINGHLLPKNALLVGKRVYVPVAEFAKAMGLTSRWDSKTGALTLSGPKQKTIALTAGSTAAQVGGTAAAALTVPVLKQAGQPVMTLDDLLTLTGGRITGRSGNVVQVKA